MKIAVYIKDRSVHGDAAFSNMDFRNPQLGNPGIGGTGYEYMLLVYALTKFSDAEVNLYCYEASNLYPDGVNVHVLHYNADIVSQVKADGSDLLVLTANESLGFYDIYERAKEQNLKLIAWSHNYMSHHMLKRLADSPAVKRVVMVSHEHYDCYLDHKIIKKSTYINNMFDGSRLMLRDYPSEPAVTYTGGLYPAKGFHVLASMWKDILLEVPDAKLYVIGSGKLYDKNAVLGAYGLADEQYEASFMQYLTENGEILPSVKFLGNLGAEKSEVYYITTAAVVNPTGASETFCISALDAQACGVPVVTRAINGLFETVKHGVTGYLGRNPEEIKNYIILLLKDKQLNIKLGRQAKDFAGKSFLPEVIVKQWLKLFDDVINDRPCEYIPPSEFRNYGHKRLKIANRWLHEHHIPTPAVSVLSGSASAFIKSISPRLHAALKKLLKR